MFYVCLLAFTKLTQTVDIEKRKRKESKHHSTKYQDITKETAKNEEWNKLQDREQLPNCSAIIRP